MKDSLLLFGENDPVKPHSFISGPAFFVDGHVDLPYYMKKLAGPSSIRDLSKGPFTLEKAKEAGVRLFCTAIYCEDRFNGEASYTHFQDILNFTLKAFDDFQIIKKKAELDQVKESQDAMSTVLLLENADVLAGDLSHVDTLIHHGIRMVGLTHVGKNRIGDGNQVRYSDGLTDQGREVVRALTENRIAIDIAHLHHKCFWQLLDLFPGPIITSHTGIKNICDTPRNIDLEQAAIICERNGVIGISFNPEMLSQDCKADLRLVFTHMDTLVQRLGPDHVGIGSDLCGYGQETKGLQDITGIKDLIQMMWAHGYGDEAIQGIMGMNWFRFYNSLY